MKRGDKIEYAAHPVSWQDDGAYVSQAAVDQETGEAAEVEDWRPATVIAVFEHPVPIHTPDAEPDTVVKLEPDDGQPPFDLNAKLVRKL